MRSILDRYEIEAQSYLDCQNILGALGNYKQKLEAACQQLLNMRGFATYSTLKRLIAATSSDQHKPAPLRAAAANTKRPAGLEAKAAGALLRGADYYRQDGEG